MSFCLGNQSINDLERRTGYVFSDEDRKWLEMHRQDLAEIKFDSDKFHIFDLPFEIHVAEPISEYLLKLLMKYENIQPSKEPLQFAVIKETEAQKQKRLECEKKEKEWQDKLHNPNSVWNIKWHMMIPVKARNIHTDSVKDLYYGCFINTYTTGRDNIPNIIDGIINIRLDEEGFHGRFILENPDAVNDADRHYGEWNWVIGSTFYSNTDFRLHPNDWVFDDIQYSIKDGLNNYTNINSGSYKEIHFDRINED